MLKIGYFRSFDGYDIDIYEEWPQENKTFFDLGDQERNFSFWLGSEAEEIILC